MENNTKTILLAVFILLIAIVSFNFTGMTGEVTSEKNVLKIISHPDGIVNRGDPITIKVTPTKDGIENRYMYIYDESSGRRMQNSKAWVCGHSNDAVCEEPSEVYYNTLGTYDEDMWPEGIYIIRVVNHKTGEDIDTKFKLKE